MKNAFDGVINRLKVVKEIISEHEVMFIVFQKLKRKKMKQK